MQQTQAAQLEEIGYHRPDLQQESTLASALTRHLHGLGVKRAFGVIGGAIGVLYDAIEESPIDSHHFRHETGAAFAAAEAHFATGHPSVVFATTGPGTLNALTGLSAARWDGAKVILLSGVTSAPQRGRWATQESSPMTLPQDALWGSGQLFDYGVRLESASELPEVMRRISIGLSQPGGFVAHIGVPISLQSAPVQMPALPSPMRIAAPAASAEDVEHCADLLKSSEFVIWAGFGARKQATAVRTLVDRSQARIMCSPRAKGLIDEEHPAYLGVTGLGGHTETTAHMREKRPDWVLVLGSRLGEATSFWDDDFEPAKGFIHVDIDPEVPGVAYPHCETIGIHAEIGRFLQALLPHFEETEPIRTSHFNRATVDTPFDGEGPTEAGRGPVRPQALMRTLQKRVVQGTDAMVMAECGNSFAWCNHYLRFPNPERYRVSTLFGSMGHFAAGVVGTALGSGRKAVAVVGDGSLLMNSEISTAVQYGAQAVWVVLNDAGYRMCENGMDVLGLTTNQLSFPAVNFVEIARAMGADGIRVETEDMLDVALTQAMAAHGPFVVDVIVDPHEASPLMQRFESLLKQGTSKNVGGWEI